ncbi:reverse transcriptase domain-containing protein [Tanacetum coccineum]
MTWNMSYLSDFKEFDGGYVYLGNQLKIENFDNASKSLDKLIGSQIRDKIIKGLGFISYNTVSPPPTGLFSPPNLDLSNSGLEEFQQPKFEGYGPKTGNNVSDYTSNEVKESPDDPMVEKLVSDDKLEKKTIFPTVDKIEFVRPKQQEKPVRKPANCNYHQRERVVSGNNYTRVNYNYSTKKAHPSAHKNMAPRAVLMKTGQRPLNTARPVNTAHPKTTVYSARPMPKAVNTARLNSAVVNVVRENQGHPQKEDQGYVDSGCSRHMTGNMSYLSDFKEFNGGYVTFGGGSKRGKITGKGTLKTVVAGTNSNDFVDGSLFDFSSKNASNDELQPSSDAGKKNDECVSQESRIDDQERPGNSTQDVNTVGPSINTASTNVNTGSLNINIVSPTITTASLEATHADFFGDETKLDMSNITTTYLVPSTPNIRIHKDHSLDHVIGDVQSGVQTRRMTKNSNEQGFISAVYEGKTHEDLHTCLFAYFLSQVEPKKADLSLCGLISNFVVKPDGWKSALVCMAKLKKKFMSINLQGLKIQSSLTEFIRYLKGQPKLGLWYPKDSPFDLEAYSDSDYAGASLDRKSTIRGTDIAKITRNGQSRANTNTGMKRVHKSRKFLAKGQQGRAPNIVEPELRTIVEIAPMAERTMEEILHAPTEGNVPNDVIKLMMFPYSLEGATKTWYEKEPPNSILTWEDLVTKFVNQFFPPSKMTHLKNKISRFTQKFDESFSEAWERFKEMLRACPHHGFTELTQVDTFYNGLNDNDQDSLNAATGGNLLSKTTREALNIIKNKSKVRYSRNKPNASWMNTTSSESDSKTDE